MGAVRQHLEFVRQFGRSFSTTGAIAPSSRFLARALVQPLTTRSNPLRVLEIGPGTGAVTQAIIRALPPGSGFDLVEVNPAFARVLRTRFATERAFQHVAEFTHIHEIPIQDFTSDAPYDAIISGLPLNNFSPELVQTIFDTCFRLLAPEGTLSYFEYMLVRPLRKRLALRANRRRLRAIDEIIRPYLSARRYRSDWVFVNLPPACVHHLRHASPRAALATAPRRTAAPAEPTIL